MSTEIMHRTSAAKCRLNPGTFSSGNHCRVCEPEHFEPADATPAPLDPSKVKAGDPVRLRVGQPDGRPTLTLSGEAHPGRAGGVYLGGWRLAELPDYVTLTDHQPAPEPEPEWADGTPGTATVNNLLDGASSLGMRVMRVTDGFAISNGALISDGNLNMSVSDFVPETPDPTQWVPMATAEKTEVQASRLQTRLNLRTIERDQMKERWEDAKHSRDLAYADLRDAQEAYEAAYLAAEPSMEADERTEPLATVVERLREKARFADGLSREAIALAMHDDYLQDGEPRLDRSDRERLADAVLRYLRGEVR